MKMPPYPLQWEENSEGARLWRPRESELRLKDPIKVTAGGNSERKSPLPPLTLPGSPGLWFSRTTGEAPGLRMAWFKDSSTSQSLLELGNFPIFGSQFIHYSAWLKGLKGRVRVEKSLCGKHLVPGMMMVVTIPAEAGKNTTHAVPKPTHLIYKIFTAV